MIISASVISTSALVSVGGVVSALVPRIAKRMRLLEEVQEVAAMSSLKRAAPMLHPAAAPLSRVVLRFVET